MKKPKLTDTRDYFKPFSYPEFYDIWLAHEQSHWLFSEVPMLEDVKDWKTKLTIEEKYFLTQIFRFFTQSDLDVAGGYINNYLPQFKQPEIRMMLCGFVAREAMHVAAYSHLIETLGMPESTYNEFNEYEAMKQKHDYFMEKIENNASTAIKIAAISAFTEGLALFSSFIMLLNFQRHGKMKGMGQIISWSIVDEAVTSETEVLCSDGQWKRIDDIDCSEKILQYDMTTQETSFVHPETIKKVQRDYTYEFSGPDFHQHTSPNHRMIIDRNGSIDELTAEEVYNTQDKDFSFILSGNKIGTLKTLTEKQKELTILSARGLLDLDWAKDLYNIIDRSWVDEFLKLFRESQ